ncbi:MAG TPA: transketolase C-terminal domain-containing protein [Patescibacteria group bacterium]|nr:transketolase C-terminal domain-containing protein [Patescibacteria group bacterium]
MPWTKVLVEKQEAILDEHHGEGQRILGYADSIREAFLQALDNDPNVYIMGQGVDDPTGMFGTTLGLHQQFGRKRVFDTPLSENALMGMAVGSAITGMRPIYMHNRPDFLLLTMDQIVNHASKWRYMFGGHGQVPLVIWAVIGRGWGSGAQHSQALQGFFMHIPGLRLVMPSTAYDAKGLLLESIADDNPVIILEHRWLLKRRGYVPKEMYRIPFGKGIVRRTGSHVTIAGVSQMIVEAQQAAEELAKAGIEAEVLDFRTLKPLDKELLFHSLAKTGRLVLVDNGWKTAGITAEICALIVEEGLDLLRAPVKRVTCPDIPTPAGYTLEAAFYPGQKQIQEAVQQLMNL